MEPKKASKLGRLYYPVLGLLSGFLNGLFGAGGGVIVVPLLERGGMEPRRAHATSIAVILALSVISTSAYWLRGNLDYTQAWRYIPGGLVGAAIGAFCLKKIPNTLLRRVFGLIIIASAVRLFLR